MIAEQFELNLTYKLFFSEENELKEYIILELCFECFKNLTVIYGK